MSYRLHLPVQFFIAGPSVDGTDLINFFFFLCVNVDENHGGRSVDQNVWSVVSETLLIQCGNPDWHL